MSEVNNSAVSESDSFGRVGKLGRDVGPVEWPVIVRPAVAGRCLITQIDPRLRWTTMAVARNRLLWGTPSQPYRIHRQTKANLPLTYQRLVPRRETLVNFGALRDARPRRPATREKQCGCCYPKRPRDVFQFVRLFKNFDEISKALVSHWLGVLLC